MEKEIYKVWKESYSRRCGYIIWEVSDQGNVKKNGVSYECRLNNCGYKVFTSHELLHKAVAMLFIPNPENKPCIDHINGNKLDNRACNLKWCSYKENSNNPITKSRQSETMKDKYKNGYVNPMHGRSQSEESCKQMSEALKGINHPMYGKHQSEESNRKRSETMKGKNTGPQSEETRRKKSESHKGKIQSKETRKKRSESMKIYWQNKRVIN